MHTVANNDCLTVKSGYHNRCLSISDLVLYKGTTINLQVMYKALKIRWSSGLRTVSVNIVFFSGLIVLVVTWKILNSFAEAGTTICTEEAGQNRASWGFTEFITRG